MFELKKNYSANTLREKFHISTVTELHLKNFLKLPVKILIRESNLEETIFLITPAKKQLLSKMRYNAISMKPSNNKTGNSTKSLCVRVRKFLNAMVKPEPINAHHIVEIEESSINCFLFFQRLKLHTR